MVGEVVMGEQLVGVHQGGELVVVMREVKVLTVAVAKDALWLGVGVGVVVVGRR
jgi:hypothetical protein